MKNLNKLFITFVLINFATLNFGMQKQDWKSKVKTVSQQNKSSKKIRNTAIAATTVTALGAALYKWNTSCHNTINSCCAKAYTYALPYKDKAVNAAQKCKVYLQDNFGKKCKVAACTLATALVAGVGAKIYAKYKPQIDTLNTQVLSDAKKCLNNTEIDSCDYINLLAQLTQSLTEEQWLQDGIAELMQEAFENPLILKDLQYEKVLNILDENQKSLILQIIKDAETQAS